MQVYIHIELKNGDVYKTIPEEVREDKFQEFIGNLGRMIAFGIRDGYCLSFNVQTSLKMETLMLAGEVLKTAVISVRVEE